MPASAPPTLEEISGALATVIAPLATQVEKIGADLTALSDRVDVMDLSFTSRLDGFIAATHENFAMVIRRLDGIDGRLDALEDTRLTLLEQRIATLESKLVG